jgi:hypothetical protein
MAENAEKCNIGFFKHLIKIANVMKWITNGTNGTTNGKNG